MASTHFKLALRQLTKNKGFTTLNILGLTLGLTTFLLIILYVADEKSYDKFNTKADRIVRINTDMILDGKPSAYADAAPPVAATLRAHYPGIEATVRICSLSQNASTAILFRKGDKEIPETAVAVADPAIFQVFTIPMIEGDPVTALQDPHAVVVTESTARRYFNTTHVVGRTLVRADDTSVHTITGVIREFPAQSSFRFDIILSLHGDRQLDAGTNFYSIFPMSTFVLLKPGADRHALDKQLDDFMRNFVGEYAAMEKENNGNFSVSLSEMPLTAIHLQSHRSDELGLNGDRQYVYIFSAIAAFVLLIAGINFMNLSTARSANRAREVGVRKVLGSLRRQLITQFLTESLLLTAVAAILAFGITAAILPLFNHLTGKEITLGAATLRWLLPALLVIIAVVGLFSGAYPAFFLSGFRPVQVLKGKLALGGKGSGLRSALVVGQFTISIFLIVGTLVVLRQLNYIRHRDPGYSRDQVLIVKGLDGMPHPTTLKADVLQLPGVTAATLSDFLPTNKHRWHNFGNLIGKGENSQKIECWLVDKDYIPTLAMHVVAGRNFEAGRGTDTAAVILNEAAARGYGITGDALGKQVHLNGGPAPKNFTIIGVVKDFNFASVRTTVEPLVLVNRPSNGGDFDAGGNLNIRIAAGHVPEVLAGVKTAFTAFAPQRPFDYSFMDNDFDTVYMTEQRMGSVVIILTALAILIACLGLFGLAAYATEQRAKEIGIRKVLGASIPSIVTLLSRDFARLIALAILIATPLSWWSMTRWLENFAYRTQITAWLFVAAAAIVLLIAALTTVFQSLKAAVTNPIESLAAE